MKTMELNQLEVAELSSAELQTVEGGLWWQIAAGAWALVMWIDANEDDIKKGYNETKNYFN